MNLAIRIFALAIVMAGAAASSMPKHTAFASQQATAPQRPMPACEPGQPCGF